MEEQPIPQIQLIPIHCHQDIRLGDDLASILSARLSQAGQVCNRGDVLVVAQKVVSKAEGRIRRLSEIRPSRLAKLWAEQVSKDARVVEAILNEAIRIVRIERGVLVTQTIQGFVCANSGVDESNARQGTVVLLPSDPDRSAEQLRRSLQALWGVPVGCIVSDTFGRPWRTGLLDFALGVAGLPAVVDFRGRPDRRGRLLKTTVIAAADALAAAGGSLMEKGGGVPAVLIKGLQLEGPPGKGRQLLRAEKDDLFR